MKVRLHINFTEVNFHLISKFGNNCSERTTHNRMMCSCKIQTQSEFMPISYT